MTQGASQIPLPLAWKPLFADDVFFVGESNRSAFLWMQTWPWPHAFSCIWGPSGSGKTHLGVLWAKKHGASFLTAMPSSLQEGGCYVWEGVPSLQDQHHLFAFYEEMHNRRASCLFLTQQPPAHWSIEREDVHSRLVTMPCFHIGLPEDDVLDHVLEKSFHDYGIECSPALRTFLIQRMPRSFDMVQCIVKKIHDHTLLHPSGINRTLLHNILLEMAP